ncbi:MAG: hypothetical protein J7621_14775 [Niastella sp.]|nr:hypothetical protein [Niastella sp.]
MKKALGIIIFLIGVLLAAVLVFSLLNISYDTTKSRANLVGQVLFDVVLGIVALLLILWGIRLSKKR